MARKSEWDFIPTRFVHKEIAAKPREEVLRLIKTSPIKRVELFTECWDGLLPVAECTLYCNDDGALQRLQHPHAPLWITNLMIAFCNARGIYDKTKQAYEERGKLVDRLQTEKSEILAENHQLRLDLKKAKGRN